ncbi:MAG TPA: metalloregulator ArsR/SmtB family transcription factor [Polyangiales bacterium]|nr:metalloregulator ArsR/SmtB family transcription factor [Polyangiales bacterium]
MSPAKSAAGSAPNVRDAAPLFAALGDQTRLQLVLRLAAHGEGSSSHLSQDAKVSRQAIAKHLEVLAGARLVRSVRRGRERVWELDPKRLDDAHRYLEHISHRWDGALARLARLVETEG